MEPLMLWGIGQATVSIFKPILENLATGLAEDVAKSYVGQVFANVFSVIHKKPLTKATGLALQELLKLIEDELLDADLEPREVEAMLPAVGQFIQRSGIQQAIAALFLEPDYALDPQVFARAWLSLSPPLDLPEDFSWPRIGKRFARKVREIRDADPELRETFTALQQRGDAELIRLNQNLPPDFDLDAYREALAERFGNLSLDSMDTSGAYYAVQLWSVFVPQSVRESYNFRERLLELPKEHQRRLLEQGEIDAVELEELEKLQAEQRSAYFEQPLQPVMELLKFVVAPSGASESALTTNGEAERFVILGDPGSGKSSLLRFLALQWARMENANQRYTVPLPILIELRDYNRWEYSEDKNFLSYLHKARTWHRLNQHTLDWLMNQKDRVVLLLDGLDEVFDPRERDLVMNDIHRFSNEYKNVRIIVTSRVVGYKAQRLRDAEFRDFMLQDLDDAQIALFLARWHAVAFTDKTDAEAKRARLAKAIANAKSIKLLAGNPLLLTMMAIINRYQELPRDRVMLYEKAAEVLLQQWDTERGLADFPGLSAEIDLRAKKAILRRIAYAMQTGKGTKKAANILHGDTLVRLIEDYLREELHFQQARAAAAALVQQLRERNFILCFLGADSYAFVHRTFLEYFCAAELVHRFHVEKSLDFDGLLKVFDEYCRDDDWREVLRLVCGQIDEGFVGRIVEFLVDKINLESWDGVTPLPKLALAVWCLGEARNLPRLKSTGEKLWQFIAQICQAAGFSSGRIPLSELLTAAKELGARWPGDLKIPTNLIWKERSYGFAYGPFIWPKLVASVFAQRSLITAWVTDLSLFWGVREGAIQALAEYWPDADTRHLLTERAVQDEQDWCRHSALTSLAKTWPDEDTRYLLIERIVQDESKWPRCAAISALAEHWPDENTRRLITERAVHDERKAPRYTALEVLAKTWPDTGTRSLLNERAVKEKDVWPRYIALDKLINNWSEEETQNLRKQYAPFDGVAACVLGKQHSYFGEIVFRENLSWHAWDNYLDPRQPIPREHIEKAAEKASVPEAKINETVQSLSAFLGWDITVGSQQLSVDSEQQKPEDDA